MSQPVPPPGNPYSDGAGQPPVGQNPYAQNPGGQAPSGGNPFAQGVPQQPGQNPFGAYPPAPAPRRNNIGLGLVAAVVAALVTAGIYGAILGGTETEIGWAAIGVGFAVGFAAGKVGGGNPVLPVVSAVLSLGAVYLGQLVGIAVYASKEFGVSFTDLFFNEFGMLTEAWAEGKDAMTFLFLALGAVAAFSAAKKASA
ncbi:MULTISPECIES: hypothetical protein [Streptomyces]|uniref:Integral membrane protein n=2 Tax=Streptomyces hydrogenans TaxID=1873719 RepID=A0ABQ3P1U2_9ACTN|nr:MULTISPECIES: hypothetical protein [Streptomyces]MCM1943985.1 hypothetical protein [Streptomyces sp. G2]GHG00477.1 hypothetical protein GCM10018784_10240 [Streptomyces hydrogenans]GHI18984.1 hypothetical protein Shyd_03550 [Streptomyces hydrogenans]